MGRYDNIPVGHPITDVREKFGGLEQPKCNIPGVVVIEAAVSGDHDQDPARRRGATNARELAKQEALAAIGAGASAVHFSAYDKDGKRSGSLDDYRHMVDTCREKFGYAFLANCNSLYGETFEEKMSAVFAGIAEEAVVNCVYRFHPKFLQASVEVMEANGCRPHLTVRDTIEISNAYDYLIKP